MSSEKSCEIEGETSDSGSQSLSEGEPMDVESELPHRLFATGRYPPKGRVNSYSKLQYLVDIVSLLDGSDELKTLLESPFGGLFRLKVTRCSCSGVIVHNMLCRQIVSENKDEMWFTFGGQPLRFSIVEFHKLTGLNCGPFRNSESIQQAMSLTNPGPYWRILIGKTDSASVDFIAGLLRREPNMCPMKKLRLCLVLIVDGILTCGTQPVMVSAATVEMVKDLDVFFGYPWGRVSYNLTLRMVKVGEKVSSKKDLVKKLKQVSVAVHGFPIAIQLLVFEAIPRLLQHLPWSDENYTFIDKEFASLPVLKSFKSQKLLAAENHKKLKVLHLYGGADPATASLRAGENCDPKVVFLESMIQSDSPDRLFSEEMWVGGDSSLPLLREADSNAQYVRSPKPEIRNNHPVKQDKVKGCKGCAELRKVVAALKKNQGKRPDNIEEILKRERVIIREELIAVLQVPSKKREASPDISKSEDETIRRNNSSIKPGPSLNKRRKSLSNGDDQPPGVSNDNDVLMGYPSGGEKVSSVDSDVPLGQEKTPRTVHDPPKKSSNQVQPSASSPTLDESHLASPNQPDSRKASPQARPKSVDQKGSKSLHPLVPIICGSSSSDSAASDEERAASINGGEIKNGDAVELGDQLESCGVVTRGMKSARKSHRTRKMSKKRIEALSSEKLINENNNKNMKKLHPCPLQTYKPLHIVDASLSAKLYSKLKAYKKTKYALDGNVVDKNFFNQIIKPRHHVGNNHMDLMLSAYSRKWAQCFKDKRIIIADSLFLTCMSSNLSRFIQTPRKDSYAWPQFLRNYVMGIVPGRDVVMPWFEQASKIYAPMNWGGKHWVALEIDLTAWHINIYDPLIINTSGRRLTSVMAPAAQLLPYLIREACAIEVLDQVRDTDFTFTRIERIGQNDRTGDCGPFSVKFIEMASQGMSSEEMSLIKDDTADQIRMRYAVDVYEEFVGKLS